MDIQLINSAGEASGNLPLAETVFNRDFNSALVHQVVVAYMAGGRAGTRAQKARSDVNGGGSKPWRQKGTGRARAGTIRSPLWRGGGVTFAARPQNYRQKVNKKMYRGALRAIFSELHRQDRLTVTVDLGLEEPRTKQALALLTRLGVSPDQRVLLLTDQIDQTLALAMRNLFNVTICTVETLAPTTLVASERVILTQAALAKIEEWLS